MHGINWDSLQWGYAEKDEFEVGPLTNNKTYQQVILNSLNLDMNSEFCVSVEKR